MPKFEIRHLAEVLGVSGVIASLIFVGLELRQSQEIAIAAQYQARATNQQDYFLTALEVSEDEDSKREARLNWLFSTYDNAHFQREMGYLDEESWQGMTNRIKVIFMDESARDLFVSRKSYYRVSFIDWMESVLAEFP